MIYMPTTMIANGGAYCFWYSIQIPDKLGNAFLLEVCVAFKRGVELVDVGLVVLCVMDAHGRLVYVRLKRIVGIRKLWKRVGVHGHLLE